MDKPLITIIVPVYNSYDYIDRCIESILKNTYKNIELILINDGSNDKSLEKLEKYKSNKKVKIINQENIGVAKTRNKGIKLATGEYIMFIDNDDFIDNTYIEEYVNNIDSNVDIIIGGYKRVNDTKELFKILPRRGIFYPYTVVAPWAKLYRKSFIIENDIKFLDYCIGEDAYFNIKAYNIENGNIKIINNIGYNWYFNDGSVSNTSQRGFNKKVDITYLFDKLEPLFKNEVIKNYYFERYAIWYLLFSGQNSNGRDFENEYQKINNWLKVNRIKDKILLIGSSYKGESIKTRMIVSLFVIIKKIGLIKIFIKLYCRCKLYEK
jgi:glycosyltransferase involved in cell wall biosynthesis